MQKTLTIATRKSALALWQAHWVGQQFCRLHPDYRYQLHSLMTAADQHQNPLSSLGGKGLFVKAIQNAVLSGQADIAVHSAKDLPCITVDGLSLAAVPARGPCHDVLVAHQTLLDLPANARIGTGSPRRTAQLKQLRPDLEIIPIRGNVPTRIEQWQAGQYDGLVLAAAGLARLDLEHHIQMAFDPKVFLPAAGQGSLAIECGINQSALIEKLNGLNDPHSHACLQAERACMEHLGGHCFAPIGAYAEMDHEHLALSAFAGNTPILQAQATGHWTAAATLGAEVAQQLNAQGAQAQLIKPDSEH